MYLHHLLAPAGRKQHAAHAVVEDVLQRMAKEVKDAAEIELKNKQIKIDAMKAKTGPAWSDFVEAINKAI